MVNRKPKTIVYRRVREGKTRYSKRIKTLLSGKPRMVVRSTNLKIIVQFVKFDVKGDLILAGVDSSSLKKFGWNYSFKSIPAAYLIGYLAGKKAVKAGVKEAVFDLGFKSPIKGNKLYASLKGAVDAGVKIPCSEEIFPGEERLSGKHIQEFAKLNKDKLMFAKYLKNNIDPSNIIKQFNESKGKIDKDA